MVAQQDANIVKVCGKTSNIMMIKGKRTKRSRPLSPLALTMSSTTTTTTVTYEGGANFAAVEEWIPPLSSDASTISEEEDMAHCLILLAKGSNQKGTSTNNETTSYECKTCNKSFSSFQALGGHRASHKKPKPTLTLPQLEKSSTPPSITFSLINTDHNHHHNNHHHRHHFDDDDTALSLQLNRPLSDTNNTNHRHHNNKGNKVHECGICGAEFSSGQALGGHMRRHRPIGTTATTTSHNIPTPLEDVTIAANNNIIKEEKLNNTRNFLSLDLNLPALEDEQNLQHIRHSSSKFVFSSNEKTLVFSVSTQLVDCHY